MTCLPSTPADPVGPGGRPDSNEVTTRLAHRGIEILRGWRDHVGVGGSGFEPVGYLLAVAGDQADGCAAEPELPQDARVAADAEPRLRRALTGGAPAAALRLRARCEGLAGRGS